MVLVLITEITHYQIQKKDPREKILVRMNINMVVSSETVYERHETTVAVISQKDQTLHRRKSIFDKENGERHVSLCSKCVVPVFASYLMEGH